ncbi:hypothetical protein [Paraburkholderia tropica]
MLANAKPLPFVTCKGALGFFNIPADAADALRKIAAAQEPSRL